MWKDKLLKTGWRVFVLVLYFVMIVSILLRFFPLTTAFKEVLNIVQVTTAVVYLLFAGVYFYRPGWVKNKEVEE